MNAASQKASPARHRPRIITVSSAKGGVGKTTFSILAAVHLCQNYFVTLIDAGFRSDYFGLFIPTPNGRMTEKDGHTLYPAGLVRKSKMRNLSLIKLPAIEGLPSPEAYWSHQQILNSLRLLETDFIIIDMANITTVSGLDLFQFGDYPFLLTGNDEFALERTRMLLQSLATRFFEKKLRRAPEIFEFIRVYFNHFAEQLSLDDYLSQTRMIPDVMKNMLLQRLQKHQPHLVVNYAEDDEQIGGDYREFFKCYGITNGWQSVRHDRSVRDIFAPGFLFNNNLKELGPARDIGDILEETIFKKKKLNEEVVKHPHVYQTGNPVNGSGARQQLSDASGNQQSNSILKNASDVAFGNAAM